MELLRNGFTDEKDRKTTNNVLKIIAGIECANSANTVITEEDECPTVHIWPCLGYNSWGMARKGIQYLVMPPRKFQHIPTFIFTILREPDGQVSISYAPDEGDEEMKGIKYTEGDIKNGIEVMEYLLKKKGIARSKATEISSRFILNPEDVCGILHYVVPHIALPYTVRCLCFDEETL